MAARITSGKAEVERKDFVNAESRDSTNYVTIFKAPDQPSNSCCNFFSCLPSRGKQAFAQETIRKIEKLRIQFSKGFDRTFPIESIDHTNIPGAFRVHIDRGFEFELNDTTQTVPLEQSGDLELLLKKIIEIIETVRMQITSPPFSYGEQARKLKGQPLSAEQQRVLLLPAERAESTGSTRWYGKLEQPPFLSEEEFSQYCTFVSHNPSQPLIMVQAFLKDYALKRLKRDIPALVILQSMTINAFRGADAFLQEQCFPQLYRIVTDQPKLATNPEILTHFNLSINPKMLSFSLTQIRSLRFLTKTSSIDIDDKDTRHGTMTVYWTINGDLAGTRLSAELSFGELQFDPSTDLDTCMTICSMLLELEKKGL